MMRLFRKLYAYWFYVPMVVTFFVFMPFIWIFCSWQKTYPIAHFLRIWWGNTSMLLSFYFYKTEWETPIDKKRNYIICFNHTSHLDILLLSAVLNPMLIRFMAKAELSKLPIFEKFFRTIDFSVNRENADDAKMAYLRADEALENGYNIAMAPEGGTSKNPPHLKPFKSGAFRLAIAHQIPVLVLTFYDNWRILPSTGTAQGWHLSRVKVHAPIETKNLKPEDYKMLSEKVKSLMQNDLQKAFPEKF